ncbi:MAG: hypothetical protein ACRDPG_10665 [Nocardioidaceae bacterium]
MHGTWWSRRAIGLHVALVLSVPGFLALGWWQLSRALGGNSLSWVYTVEWPFFSAYAIYMWWKLLHTGSEPRGPVQVRAEPVDDPYDEAEPELAAYNRYLASLHASDPAAPRGAAEATDDR